MAEFVQSNLEDMLNEVEQMARVKLFATSETRAILKKRKAFEYKLQRKTKQKEDFLSYIQYEINVLALIKKRREVTGYHFKKLDIEIAIVSRIHRLFRMVCNRFQDDVKLWLSHLEFAKSRNEKSTVSKLYTRMLQVHNRKPGLWIAAAKSEMEDNASMENARSILQRALRFLPESEKLWVEYFRMELLNVDKLKKRREVLGLAHLDVDDAEVADKVVEGKIVEVVFKQAVVAIPNNIDFVLAFLPVLRVFSFAKDVENDVYNHLMEVYPNAEKAWDALARRHLNPTPQPPGQENGGVEVAGEDRCTDVYEEAVTKLQTDLMWSLYLNTCIELLEDSEDDLHTKKCLQNVLHVLTNAEDNGHVTEDMYLQWIGVLQRTGQTAEIERVCQKATTGRYRKSASLWRQRLSHVIRLGHPDVETLLREALEGVPEKEGLPIWKLGLEHHLLHDLEKAEALFEAGVVRDATVAAPLKVLYLEFSAYNHSISKTRKLYARLAASQPLNEDFFRTYIAIEKAQTELKMKRIRQGYEDALREYGPSNTDIWLEYIGEEMTLSGGTPARAGELNWRALKALEEGLTESFVTKYTLLQVGK